MKKKGFTLAELLVVVAIISVLVAIAIPTFGTKAEQSKESVDATSIRNAMSQAYSEYITTGKMVKIKVELTQSTEKSTGATGGTWDYVEEIEGYQTAFYTKGGTFVDNPIMCNTNGYLIVIVNSKGEFCFANDESMTEANWHKTNQNVARD